MTSWPIKPIATLVIVNGPGSAYSYGGFNPTMSTTQTVTDARIDFTVNIAYNDHAIWDHGRGFFSIELEKVTVNGLQTVDAQSKTLGNHGSGDWFDTITVSDTMVEPQEKYRISYHAVLRDVVFGAGDLTGDDWFTAIQGVNPLGSFTLDFVPLTILYCPPGQDMTNSLTQSLSFGTRFTVGESMVSDTESGAQVKIDYLGLFAGGIGSSNSQGGGNTSSGGIQISHFRTTVLTADNQKAIGRAYWGPLSDLFVVLVNPAFAVSERADHTILYSPKTIEQVLVIPAWKLLRPNGDPIASLIPDDTRRRLLELDPFISNLDSFFPDSGADLNLAANPYADPSANNRAELLGRWWLDSGAELNYSLGEQHELFSNETNELKFGSKVSFDESLGVNYDDVKVALGVDANSMTTVGFQSSKETTATKSVSAACFLIHNQNDRDLDGIELYYDKHFSTFMFRRIRSRRIDNIYWRVLQGTISNYERVRLQGLQVRLQKSEGVAQQTSTDATGAYSFYNLAPGEYTLFAGDQRTSVIIEEDSSPVNPQRLDLTGVRRVIDLYSSPMWELVDALNLPSDVIREIGRQLPSITNESHLARVTGADPTTLERWRQAAVLIFPRTSHRPWWQWWQHTEDEESEGKEH